MTPEAQSNSSPEQTTFSGADLAAELLETQSPERASNLSPDLARVVQTEEFKQWFGDTKLVDENGDPRVFYHGGAAGVTDFSRESPRNTGEDQHGYYFTPSKGMAQSYLEKYASEEQEEGREPNGALYRVFLRSEHPFAVARGSGVASQSIDELPPGRDAYINEVAKEVVVFDPRQVYIVDELPLEQATRDRPPRPKG